MKLKTGRNEIVYLLTKVLEKYESETGEPVIRNTNRKNYEGVARKLSEISNELPNTAEVLQHNPYPPDYNVNKQDYPSRKYDITASQIKDAYNGIVNNPRSFLVDACYIYLFGSGRKGFSGNPQDSALLEDNEIPAFEPTDVSKENEALQLQLSRLEEERKALLSKTNINSRRQHIILFTILALVFTAASVFYYKWRTTGNEWEAMKKDLFILPYQPTQAEINNLEGVWISYTGSPQARSSDPNRYHQVISNILEVKYKEGYFKFDRYGSNFDHVGYMQYESPGIVSIHSFAKNNTGSLAFPKHSIMRLEVGNEIVPVISASWSFDSGNQNKIIGIREVFIKQGKGGSIEEIINSTENVSCHCKIIKWHHEKNNVKFFYLKNELLDTLPDQRLRPLLDERSILPRIPQEITILSSDTIP